MRDPEELDAINREHILAALKEHGPDDVMLACCLAEMPSVYDDNAFATCCLCGVEIIHRPWVPQVLRKGCMACVAKEAKKEKDTDVGGAT